MHAETYHFSVKSNIYSSGGFFLHSPCCGPQRANTQICHLPGDVIHLYLYQVMTHILIPKIIDLTLFNQAQDSLGHKKMVGYEFYAELFNVASGGENLPGLIVMDVFAGTSSYGRARSLLFPTHLENAFRGGVPRKRSLTELRMTKQVNKR